MTTCLKFVTECPVADGYVSYPKIQVRNHQIAYEKTKIISGLYLLVQTDIRTRIKQKQVFTRYHAIKLDVDFSSPWIIHESSYLIPKKN